MAPTDCSQKKDHARRKAVSTWLFLLVSLSALFSTFGWAGPLKTGNVAPDWMLMDSNNEPVGLYQDSEAGNTVVMIFWASWCSICHDLIPQLEKLQNEVKAAQHPIKFYALNVWEDGDPLAYIDTKKLSMKILLDADKVALRYGIQLSPGVVIVGQDKRIKYIADAQTQADEITRQVKGILTGEHNMPVSVPKRDKQSENHSRETQEEENATSTANTPITAGIPIAPY